MVCFYMKSDKIIHLSKLRSILLTSTEVVTIIAVLVFFYAFTGARNQIINEKIRNLEEETIELTINLRIYFDSQKKIDDTINNNDLDMEIKSIIERSITDKNLKAFIIDSKGKAIYSNQTNSLVSLKLDKDKSMMKSFEYDNSKHILSYRKIESYKENMWAIVLLKDQSLLLQGYSYNRMGLVILAIILFLFSEHIITYLYIRKVASEV